MVVPGPLGLAMVASGSSERFLILVIANLIWALASLNSAQLRPCKARWLWWCLAHLSACKPHFGPCKPHFSPVEQPLQASFQPS